MSAANAGLAIIATRANPVHLFHMIIILRLVNAVES
jgi:hypothetical protein